MKKIILSLSILFLITGNVFSAGSSSSGGDSESAKTKTNYEKAVAHIKVAKKHEKKGKLEKANKSITYLSESAILARMNWWTVEYGLIGEINNPKIYGAGLLSSIGESEWCMSNAVKKKIYDINACMVNFDITKPQPQLT